MIDLHERVQLRLLKIDATKDSGHYAQFYREDVTDLLKTLAPPTEEATLDEQAARQEVCRILDIEAVPDHVFEALRAIWRK